jgi:hypothetical protein
VCRSLAASPTLGECFALFEVLHQITTNHAAIRRIAREALEDFAADNVFYAEIRTTPKCRSETGVSRESYVEAVLQVHLRGCTRGLCACAWCALAVLGAKGGDVGGGGGAARAAQLLVVHYMYVACGPRAE